MIVGYDGANDVAIRNRYAQRDAYTRMIAGSTSTGSPLVLTSTDASTMWMPTYPANC